jgi:hypothetical protein
MTLPVSYFGNRELEFPVTTNHRNVLQGCSQLHRGAWKGVSSQDIVCVLRCLLSVLTMNISALRRLIHTHRPPYNPQQLRE